MPSVPIQGLPRLFISSVGHCEVCVTDGYQPPWQRADHMASPPGGCVLWLSSQPGSHPIFCLPFCLCCKETCQSQSSSIFVFLVKWRLVILVSVRYHADIALLNTGVAAFFFPTVAVRWHHHIRLFFLFCCHTLTDSLVSFHAAEFIY